MIFRDQILVILLLGIASGAAHRAVAAEGPSAAVVQVSEGLVTLSRSASFAAQIGDRGRLCRRITVRNRAAEACFAIIEVESVSKGDVRARIVRGALSGELAGVVARFDPRVDPAVAAAAVERQRLQEQELEVAKIRREVADEEARRRRVQRERLARILEDGEAALGGGGWAKASELARAALEVSPDDERARSLDQKATILRKHEETLRRSREACLRDMDKAKSLSEEGSWPLVIEASEAALSLDGQCPGASGLLQEAQRAVAEAGKRELAIAESERLAEQAAIALGADDLETARRLASGALSRDATNLLAIRSLDEANRRIQERERLEKLLDEAAHLVADGQKRLQKGDWRTARDRATRASELDPESARARELIARALEAAEREAIARRANESLVQSRERLAAGDWKGALQAAQEGLSLTPTSSKLEQAKRNAEVEGERQRRLVALRHEASMIAARARSLLVEGTPQQAHLQAKKALEKDPSCLEAREVLAKAMAILEEQAKAQRTREAVARRLVEARGWLKAGDTRRARLLAEEALRIDSNDGVATELLREIDTRAAAERVAMERRRLVDEGREEATRFLGEGDIAGARQAVAEVLDLDPQNEVAKGLRRTILETEQAKQARRRSGASVSSIPTRDSAGPAAPGEAIESLRAARLAVAARPQDIAGVERAREMEGRLSLPKEKAEIRTAAKLRLIPGGLFRMGCSRGDSACELDELPDHSVLVSRPFYLMETEATNQSFQTCVRAGGCKALPARSGGPDSRQEADPVVMVTWDEASAFCSWMGGRLPSEAEWEIAARGGLPGSSYPWGSRAPTCRPFVDGGARFADEGECDGHPERGARPWPVASFKPNGFGVFDMAGNVWEWTLDGYVAYPQTDGVEIDPILPSQDDLRIVRGGSWYNYPRALRVSARGNQRASVRDPKIGFRCLVPAVTP